MVGSWPLFVLRNSVTFASRMIVGFFLQILYVFVFFVVGFLPVVAMPVGWVSALALIWGYINAMNFLFPVSTLLLVLSFALLFHVLVLLFRFGLWVIHVIRGR